MAATSAIPHSRPRPRLARRRAHVRLLFVMLLAMALGSTGHAQPERLVSYPELLLYNANIVTMDNTSYSEEVGRRVQAMAVRGDVILALGGNDEILALAGPNTQKIDLKGHTVIPGIVNSHTHVHDGAINRWAEQAAEKPVAVFNITGSTHDEISRGIEVTLRERTSRLRPREWIFLNLPATKFIGTQFLQDRRMTMTALDAMMPDHPVILNAHPAYTLNSAAKQRLAEMYGAKPNTEEIDATGFSPVGVEYRRVAVVDDFFKNRVELLADVLEQDLQSQAAAGITTFTSHIMGARYFDAYVQLVREGRMPIRFAYTHYMGSVLNPGIEQFAARLGDMAGFGDNYFWQAGVGAGYADSGPPMICTSLKLPPEDKKREWCRLAPGSIFGNFVYNGLANRVRVVVGHNYGDKTADQFMDMLDRLVDEQGFSVEYIRSRRFTMDHCGLYPRPDQLPRMRKFGIMLSCGSNILTRSYPWLRKYGMEYADWMSPIKSALDAGVKVVFESEEGLDGGLFRAFVPYITRKNDFGIVVSEKNAVHRNIVMKMATSWGAEFALKEDKVGTLEEGKWADFLVLNKDYFTIPVEEIEKTYPIITVVGGKIRYVRSDHATRLGLDPVGQQLRYGWETGKPMRTYEREVGQ